MRNKLIVLITALAVLVTSPIRVSAQYGQEVLGETAPEVVIEHEAVDTGIADNPAVLAGVMFVVSGVLYKVSKKKNILITSTS